jgi:hypothetical protein
MARELIAVTLDIRLREVAVDLSCGAMDGIDRDGWHRCCGGVVAALHHWALNLHHQR